MARSPQSVRPVLLIVVGVCVVGLLVAGLPRLVERQRTRDLHQATRSAYDMVQPAWNQLLFEDATGLSPVLGDPVLRSRSVRCVLDNDQAGLMIESWRQECSLRAVDLYPTTSGFGRLSSEVRAATSGTPASGRLGAVPDGPAPAHGCGPLRVFFDPSQLDALRVQINRLQAGRFLTADDPSAVNEPCAAPPTDVDTYGMVRYDATFDPADVSPDRSWVAVTHDVTFFQQDLGCRGPVFCGAPVGQAVLP